MADVLSHDNLIEQSGHDKTIVKLTSRALVQRFIRERGVLVEGKKTTKPHTPVASESQVTFSAEEFIRFVKEYEESSTAALEEIKVPRLFESELFIVFNKPPHLTTELLTKGLFAVHRLDKDTSGVIIAAKSVAAQRALQAQWQARTVRKSYCALVVGALEPENGAIEAAIGRSSKDRMVMEISRSKRARKAFTEYEVDELFTSPLLKTRLTLLHAFPKTGRTHQIRVHCSSIKHPILGDTMYGDRLLNEIALHRFGLARQFLHAEALELDDIVSGKRITFEAPLATDLADVLKKVRAEDKKNR